MVQFFAMFGMRKKYPQDINSIKKIVHFLDLRKVLPHLNLTKHHQNNNRTS